MFLFLVLVTTTWTTWLITGKILGASRINSMRSSTLLMNLLAIRLLHLCCKLSLTLFAVSLQKFCEYCKSKKTPVNQKSGKYWNFCRMRDLSLLQSFGCRQCQSRPTARIASTLQPYSGAPLWYPEPLAIRWSWSILQPSPLRQAMISQKPNIKIKGLNLIKETSRYLKWKLQISNNSIHFVCKFFNFWFFENRNFITRTLPCIISYYKCSCKAIKDIDSPQNQQYYPPQKLKNS